MPNLWRFVYNVTVAATDTNLNFLCVGDSHKMPLDPARREREGESSRGECENSRWAPDYWVKQSQLVSYWQHSGLLDELGLYCATPDDAFYGCWQRYGRQALC